MLQAEDLGSLLSESKNLGLLARYQERLITDYTITLDQLQSAEEELELKKEEIAELISSAQQKRQELEIQRRKYNALLREIDRNKKTHLKTLEELNERAEQLQLLIKKLLEKKISLPIRLIPLYERKGKLPWPIEGKLITRFGLQKHHRFNTLTINNGIEISPKKDEAVVKSIHPGKVVYTDYFQGYGNLIIIDHGMNYYSLYGHCSDFLVKKGDFVEKGQPISLIGDIGSLKGVTLYLEIRFKTKPLDPLRWLKRR
jgi:murein DD-endopeptidase MepM/ murein hydrolase activator NlpD